MTMKAKIGIYNQHFAAMGGGEKVALVLAEHLSRDYSVILFADEPLDVPSLESHFGVNLSRIKIITFSRPFLPHNVVFKLPGLRRPYEAALRRTHFSEIKAQGLDVFINNSFSSDLTCPVDSGVYVCMFPHLPSRLKKSLLHRAYHSLWDRIEKIMSGRSTDDPLRSYSVIATVSCYSREWIKSLWGRHADVVYAPCDDMGPPAPKEKMILNVGRFYAVGDGSFLKRQDALLECFKGLRDIHREGWQLHFAGVVGRNERSLINTERLIEAAKGYPVFFHFAPHLEALRELYRRASLYWHATGYGHPAGEHPAEQEHFGVTTVEAMSAGAVPVVINSGGQRESVTHDVDGLLWDDLKGLAEQTMRVINDPGLWGRLSRQAVKSSGRFSRDSFTARMEQIVKELIPGRSASPHKSENEHDHDKGRVSLLSRGSESRQRTTR
jgi:glycosyltransferase involved in cell wall biosynthesis